MDAGVIRAGPAHQLLLLTTADQLAMAIFPIALQLVGKMATATDLTREETFSSVTVGIKFREGHPPGVQYLPVV